MKDYINATIEEDYIAVSLSGICCADAARGDDGKGRA